MYERLGRSRDQQNSSSTTPSPTSLRVALIRRYENVLVSLSLSERSLQVVTVTNYTGKDREYLKKLITLMGGEFTASMSADKNTTVVAA